MEPSPPSRDAGEPIHGQDTIANPSLPGTFTGAPPASGARYTASPIPMTTLSPSMSSVDTPSPGSPVILCAVPPASGAPQTSAVSRPPARYDSHQTTWPPATVESDASILDPVG